MQPYRLGIDLGTNSIGWAILGLDKNGEPDSLIDLGSRIFHDGRDPKSGESAAVQRRLARQMRRTRDRKLRRKKKLLNLLTVNGFFPTSPEEREKMKSYDPYVLRVRALDRKLEPFELGRALYHLSQRRGFKSSRKSTGATKDDENAKLAPLLEDLAKRILESESRTFGEYLSKIGKVKRNRPESLSLHPTRQMIEDEFYAILRTQQSYHHALTNKLIADLHHCIFHQRPLRSVKDLVGPCELYPETEKRAPNYLPSVQNFKLIQTIGQLKIIEGAHIKELSLDQKKIIYDTLNRKTKESFDKLRKLLNLSSGTLFNLESSTRKDINGNTINATFKGKDYFGKKWLELSLKQQDQIINDLEDAEDDEQLQKLIKNWPLPPGPKVMGRDTLDKLPKGHGAFSQKAAYKLCQEMFNHGFCRYDQAREILGFKLGEEKITQLKTKLPYYGEVLVRDSIPRPEGMQKNEQDKQGRIPNPTVHIALNQLRLVINAIVDRYGSPAEIVVELTRDMKMNKKQKANYEKQLNTNKKANDNAKNELAKLNIEVSRDSIERYKVWKEQHIDGIAQCPYTGKSISVRQAFSQEFQIEHILPFSHTLDDSFANKVLACAKANQKKGERSPYEAFGDDPEIIARISQYPANKRWRFYADAMERFKDQNEWLARQLNDTRYMSKVARRYVSHICPRVNVTKGVLTGKIRYALGLNSLLSNDDNKNRSDHRHHALDAVVIGLCSQKFLNKMLKNTQANQKTVFDVPEPWPNFRNNLNEKIQKVITSIKPDHSIEGAFFEETAYGVLPEPVDGHNVTIRKTPEKITIKKVSSIIDQDIRNIAEILASGSENEKDFQEILKKELNAKGIFKIKTYEKQNPLSIIRHPKNRNNFHKGYVSDQVHHLSVWEYPDGSWKCFGLSVFDVNRCKNDNELTQFLRNEYSEDKKDCLHPAAKKVMKIHKGDYLYIPDGDKKGLWRILSISPSNKRFFLINPNKPDSKKENLMFSHLKKLGIKRIKSSPLGMKACDL